MPSATAMQPKEVGAPENLLAMTVVGVDGATSHLAHLHCDPVGDCYAGDLQLGL